MMKTILQAVTLILSAWPWRFLMNATVNYVLTTFPSDVAAITVWATRKQIQSLIDGGMTVDEAAGVVTKAADKILGKTVTYTDSLEEGAVVGCYNIFNGLVVRFQLAGLEAGIASTLKEVAAKILVHWPTV